MAIKLHNTLTDRTEEFRPIDPGKVRMYHCGPTVYDYVHIGNLRSFLLADILRRVFEYEGFEVKQVMNITDVGIGGNNDEGEDKIIRGLKREGKEISMQSMKELGEFYTEKFKEDIAELNIKTPDVLPKASEHIVEQIELIKVLEEKRFTYKTSDGIYFDTSKDPEYGRLGKLGKDTESRVENSEKRNSRDFALWKFNENFGFPSPWGQGFPGWHIECSAMSVKYLGETFDIHTGGIDLAPIHHNNEIAQSENACSCELAHYWLHNEFVNVPEGKMAKSEGNQITIRDLVQAGFSPLAYRYFLLLAHYRTPVTFSWDALTAAQNAFDKLKKVVERLDEGGKVDEAYKAKFTEKLENDLNTAQALAVLWTLVKDKDVANNDKLVTLRDFDKVLGLGL
ncbi:MAG: cysteine--tRNA ligase [Candidatus Zambryskibacteria bacterium RIFCSPLOWO2_02_FULL_51_21]|uniref:Cysteine--tRNA ligase n=1 Tax=Candidatus Zambryskibacteria bacterium RIFCSPHIGHO2_02_FULL_43_37 TaxID=1802749 RepID=A0A1G2TIS8_9BACT|nr:MAG: cysteine--tRNA ligase [Candidatus Zambryskibacteria bacterium RIFCSPHIGHO2_01_FULL_52_18]OHA96579.1 MAG: cysteine--tRNA ligase [Candidatus Zambryskibacteria bacterium RIFCSPHIGHO2_02_FULL_43_37]OHB07628.1 MAG: cysteine--tRNA ligase [Candidatus Zambryskibacteria bacterium RIFCSPLOWO2_01_FULL_52_12]OHB11157.1 MAG: cysteine--tRNA ligase [Candidatus Zambryskibacteria bacterium RIFCSPLOWO2_02_FULL_51_21]